MNKILTTLGFLFFSLEIFGLIIFLIYKLMDKIVLSDSLVIYGTIIILNIAFGIILALGLNEEEDRK